MHPSRWILCSLFLLIAVSALPAQDNSVKCESNDGNRNYCGNYRYNQVQLERQVSGSACIQERTWGVDGRGLWVDRGCRAYFRVVNFQGGNRPGYGNNDGWWDRDPNDSWPPRGNWRGGNWGRGGACFYKERNFEGSFFCMRRGERRESLPGYGDKITSVRVFGGARVVVFDDSDFRGARGTFRRDIADLRNRDVRQKPDHTWNNRISSLSIE